MQPMEDTRPLALWYWYNIIQGSPLLIHLEYCILHEILPLRYARPKHTACIEEFPTVGLSADDVFTLTDGVQHDIHLRLKYSGDSFCAYEYRACTCVLLYTWYVCSKTGAWVRYWTYLTADTK